MTVGDHRRPPSGHLDERDLHHILSSARVADDQVGTAHQGLAVGHDEHIEGLERPDHDGHFALGGELRWTILEIEPVDFSIGNEKETQLPPAHRHGHGSQVRIH